MEKDIDKDKLVMHGDIEEQLESYVIRKNKDPPSNSKEPAKSKSISDATVYQCAPLLFKDLKNCSMVDTENTYKTMVGSQEVFFRTCISYVYIVAGSRDNDYFHTYLVDDGSAQMDLSIFRKTKELREIAEMQVDINELSKCTIGKNKELFAALQRLLRNASEQINGSKIKGGAQLLIYGKPRLYNEQINFVAYSFCEENEGSCVMELLFKDYMVDWYTKLADPKRQS